jgi:hypothetical protein
MKSISKAPPKRATKRIGEVIQNIGREEGVR